MVFTAVRKDGGVMNPDHDNDARSPYFKAVAIDFDGTLAEGGAPSPSVRAAVRSVRDLGLRLLLVTGRTLADLRQVFPDVDEHFDLTVAENGAILRAAEGHRRLARPIDPELAKALQGRGLSVQSGEVILACDAVHDAEVFEEIRRLDLDCQLIRNRGALMVVPAGVTKASGLGAGLRELGLSAHSAIAIGDAENDLALLEAWRWPTRFLWSYSTPTLCSIAPMGPVSRPQRARTATRSAMNCSPPSRRGASSSKHRGLRRELSAVTACDRRATDPGARPATECAWDR
jgi:haloacid dehalogenase-like hydrolase